MQQHRARVVAWVNTLLPAPLRALTAKWAIIRTLVRKDRATRAPLVILPVLPALLSALRVQRARQRAPPALAPVFLASLVNTRLQRRLRANLALMVRSLLLAQPRVRRAALVHSPFREPRVVAHARAVNTVPLAPRLAQRALPAQSRLLVVRPALHAPRGLTQLPLGWPPAPLVRLAPIRALLARRLARNVPQEPTHLLLEHRHVPHALQVRKI